MTEIKGWGCLGCNTAYKKKPTQDYNDGHGGRDIEMCRCGCDLFVELVEVDGELKPLGVTDNG